MTAGLPPGSRPSCEPERGDAAGSAMITVIVLGAILTLLAIASLTEATSMTKRSHYDEDWNAALAASEAGIDNYLYQLRKDAQYWWPDHGGSVPLGPNASKPTATWGTVASGSGQYYYTVDASKMATDRLLTIQSTGDVGSARRTVLADLRRSTFLDYLLVTDIEVKDVDLFDDPPYDATWAAANCDRYEYDVRGRSDRCRWPENGDPNNSGWLGSNYDSPWYAYGETFNGPVHSNDVMYMSGCTPLSFNILGLFTWTINSCNFGYLGPNFRDKVTTSWLDGTGQNYKKNPNPTIQTEPGFAVGDRPERLGTLLKLPTSNSSLKQQTDRLVNNGCLYTGPTYIKIHGDRMDVRSPYTDSDPNQAQYNCPTGTNVPLPKDKYDSRNGSVVYVQNVPATHPASACSAGNWNHPLNRTAALSDNPVQGERNVTNLRLEYELDTRQRQFIGYSGTLKLFWSGNEVWSTNWWTIGRHDHERYTLFDLGSTIWTWSDARQYDCKKGDLFIEGNLTGSLTAAAENDVVITWNLQYDDKARDLLGLIANEHIEIYHPVFRKGTFQYCSPDFWLFGILHFNYCQFSFSIDINCPGIRIDALNWSWCELPARDPDGRGLSSGANEQLFINPQVHAAMLALKHSFRVQSHDFPISIDRFNLLNPNNSDKSPLGTIYLFGSLAQKYYGPIGRTYAGWLMTAPVVNGYRRNLDYDTKLKTQTPPYFLEPALTQWQVKTWREVDTPSPCTGTAVPPSCLPGP